MGSEAVHGTLGLGAIGGGFFLGVWLIAIGDLCTTEREDFKIHSYVHALCTSAYHYLCKSMNRLSNNIHESVNSQRMNFCSVPSFF